MGRPRTRGPCELCACDCSLTLHHLIPRTLHANGWFRSRFDREALNRTARLCRDCHSAVHEHISEKELGRQYNTLEALREHPEIGKYVEWVRNRPGRHRTRTPRR